MSLNKITPAVEYARASQKEYLAGFQELLRIPSVSTDPAHKADVQRAAEWIAAELSRIGFKNSRAIPSAGHPVVYGEWLEAGDDKPTVLVYAHYDVQPVDPLDLWDTPPFEPVLKDGKLYARGTIDDKCGVFVNLKAFESILQTDGRLPVNVKVFFEGEEENGSPNMEPFVIKYKELLTADLLLISDGGSLPDQPLNITSVRGIIDGEVFVKGPARDLHSGSFGGIVHNPAHKAAEIIAALHDADGRVQIPGFYDDVAAVDAAEQQRMDEQNDQTKAYMKERSGIKAFWGPPEYSFMERATAQPTCDVNGISSGYQGQGSKTIIPSKASFKVSMRLVANQNPDDIAAKFLRFVDSFRCETLDIQGTVDSKSWAAQLLTQGPAVEAINRAFEVVWGKRPLMYRQGGSVPIIGMFQRELGMPITTLGYGVGDNGHAPNEYIFLDYFYRGIDTAIHFYYYLAEETAAAEGV